MADDSILRIGTAVDLAPLKSGMQEAAATVRNQLRAIADESRQTAATIRQNLSGIGGEALASQIEQATTKAVGALSELEAAQSELSSSPAGVVLLQSIRRQIEADLAEQRAVLEQLRQPLSASSPGVSAASRSVPQAPPVPAAASEHEPVSRPVSQPATPIAPVAETNPAPIPPVLPPPVLATGERSPSTGVVNLPIKDIQADPARFQFKANTGGAAGVGDELKNVQKFDPELAGVVAVWKDPQDGKSYIVNGHHRLELANRTGAENITARYIDAATAGEARIKGALINIAEGRGTSVDAAKVFRDGQFTPEDLASKGVSLRGSVAREGMALSRLAPSIFDRVVQGDLAPQRAAVIGEHLESHDEQKAALDLLGRAEARGKRPTNSEVKELIDFVKGGPKEEVQSNQASLFGEDTIQKNLALEKAEISDSIRRRLSQERRLFSTTGTASAAEQLGQAGNVIKPEENARLAEQASQAQAVYDKLKTSAGPINDVLNASARQLASGNPQQVKADAYERVRQAISDTLRGTESPSAPGDRRVSERPAAAPREPEAEAVRSAGQTSLAPRQEVASAPPAAPPAAPPPPPPPPSAPPSAPPPDDDGEEKRRQQELAARQRLAAEEQELAAQVAAKEIASANESAEAQKAALARVEAARKQVEAQRSKPLSSATIDADLELQAAEKELAALQGTKAEETAVAEQSAERRTQAARQAAEAETTASTTGARAVESAAQSATGSVIRSTEEQKGAIAGIGVLEQETAEQSAAAVAEAAAAKTASIQESTAAAAEASAGQAAAQIESVQQARAAQEEAATGLRARVQSAAGQIRNSFRELWEGVTTSAQEANAGITQAVTESGEAQVHAGAATATTLRHQLSDLQKQRKAAAKEEEAAYGQLAEVQAIFAQRAANGDREAAAVLAEYTAQLDAAKAKTQQLAVATDQVALALKGVSTAAEHTVPQMAAASGAIRVFEGQMPIRAVERFLSTVLGLAPVLQAAFPVVGAIALGEMLVDVAEKASDLYQNFVNLKNIQEEIASVSEKMAKDVEASFERSERAAIAHLKHIGKDVEAAKKQAALQESTPIDLRYDFKNDKELKKNLAGLKPEQQAGIAGTFTEIIPAELPAKLDQINRKIHDTGEALNRVKKQSDANDRSLDANTQVGVAIYLDRIRKRLEAEQEFYKRLKEVVTQRSAEHRNVVVNEQDAINDAQARELIRGAQQRIDHLKQEGQDSAAAEKEIWQGVLSQLHKGTAAYREVENKLGSASTKRDRNTVAQELRKADQDELTEMRLHAAETGQAQEALLAQEETFVRRRIEAERQYVDNVRALRSELVRIEQEEERARIQSENRHAATLVTPEGKPDYAARLDYYNSVLAKAADAKNAVQELENAQQHAALAGAEAIRQTNEDVKQSVEREYDAWIAAGHRTEAEIVQFWEDVKTRYAADAPLVEEALHKIAEALAKVREEQEKLQLGGLTLRHEANQDQFSQQEASVKATYSLGGETSPDRRRELTELMRIHAEELQEEIRFLAQMAQLESSEGHQAEALRYYEKILAAQRQYHKQRVADETQLTLEIEKPYRRLFSTLEQEMRSALNQMMSGQRTFGQAMAGLWNNLVEQIGAGIATMVMRWLAGEILMTVAHAAANQTRVASDASATAQSTALHEAANLKQKLSDAKVAAAEAFKATVGIPVVGPVLAPIAAAGAFAAVAAFEQGGIVPNTGMALVHGGEMVLPADISEKVQASVGQPATVNNTTLSDGLNAGLLQQIATNTANTAAALGYKPGQPGANGPAQPASPSWSDSLWGNVKQGFLNDVTNGLGLPNKHLQDENMIQLLRDIADNTSTLKQGILTKGLGLGLGLLGIPFFEDGGLVDATGPAVLHKDEMVLPAAIAQHVMATAGNAYRDSAAPQAIVPMHPALFQPSAASSSSHALNTSLQQVLAQTRGDTHYHAHVTSSPTFHGAKDPDMKALLSEHADHIGRLVHRQMKQYNR